MPSTVVSLYFTDAYGRALTCEPGPPQERRCGQQAAVNCLPSGIKWPWSRAEWPHPSPDLSGWPAHIWVMRGYEGRPGTSVQGHCSCRAPPGAGWGCYRPASQPHFSARPPSNFSSVEADTLVNILHANLHRFLGMLTRRVPTAGHHCWSIYRRGHGGSQKCNEMVPSPAAGEQGHMWWKPSHFWSGKWHPPALQGVSDCWVRKNAEGRAELCVCVCTCVSMSIEHLWSISKSKIKTLLLGN